MAPLGQAAPRAQYVGSEAIDAVSSPKKSTTTRADSQSALSETLPLCAKFHAQKSFIYTPLFYDLLENILAITPAICHRNSQIWHTLIPCAFIWTNTRMWVQQARDDRFVVDYAPRLVTLMCGALVPGCGPACGRTTAYPPPHSTCR